MRSGELREQITIQAKTETISDSGDVSFNWYTFATCFGKVRTIRGYEKIKFDKAKADVDHIVTVRAFDALGIKPEMRILWTDKSVNRILNIVWIGEDRTHDRVYDISCIEGRD